VRRRIPRRPQQAGGGERDAVSTRFVLRESESAARIIEAAGIKPQ
jgi:hypothetical protein